MQTITWERTATKAEKRFNLLNRTLLLLAVGTFFTLIGMHNPKRTPVVGIFLLALGGYCLLKYLLVPSERKVPDVYSCSLTIVESGIIYTKNKLKKFFLFKDILQIKADKENVIVEIKGFPNQSSECTGLYIPEIALDGKDKEAFIRELTDKLPQENVVTPYELTSQNNLLARKKSKIWVYIGIGLVVLICVSLGIFNNA